MLKLNSQSDRLTGGCFRVSPSLGVLDPLIRIHVAASIMFFVTDLDIRLRCLVFCNLCNILDLESLDLSDKGV